MQMTDKTEANSYLGAVAPWKKMVIKLTGKNPKERTGNKP
jgi:hypothetical protein